MDYPARDSYPPWIIRAGGTSLVIGLTNPGFFKKRKRDIPMTFKPSPMKYTTIIITALAVLMFVFVAGCASNAPPAPVATPTPTPVPTAAPTIATVATTAPGSEPLQVLPAAQQVSLALTKDRPTSEIHLLYEGGPGNLYTNTITLRVYSSPTQYKEYVMNDGKKLAAGMEIVAPGTSGSDRCEVFVVSSGTRYKVMDQQIQSMR